MLDWAIEHERFERVAYHRTLKAAASAFKGWHERKREDAIAEMVARCGTSGHGCSMRARTPSRCSDR